MNPKLIKTLLIAAAVGFLILWILEAIRTSIGDSYWLLMMSISFLLWYQYYRLRLINREKAQNTATPKKKPVPPKRKKKR